MNILRSSDKLTPVLSNKPLVMAYLSGTNCSVCHSIKQNRASLSQHLMIQMVEIPTEQFPEYVAQLMVFFCSDSDIMGLIGANSAGSEDDQHRWFGFKNR